MGPTEFVKCSHWHNRNSREGYLWEPEGGVIPRAQSSARMGIPSRGGGAGGQRGEGEHGWEGRKSSGKWSLAMSSEAGGEISLETDPGRKKLQGGLGIVALIATMNSNHPNLQREWKLPEQAPPKWNLPTLLCLQEMRNGLEGKAELQEQPVCAGTCSEWAAPNNTQQGRQFLGKMGSMSTRRGHGKPFPDEPQVLSERKSWCDSHSCRAQPKEGSQRSHLGKSSAPEEIHPGRGRRREFIGDGNIWN